MMYKKFQPDQKLAPFVDCFFVWERETKESLWSKALLLASMPWFSIMQTLMLLLCKKIKKSKFPGICIRAVYRQLSSELKGKIGMVGIGPLLFSIFSD